MATATESSRPVSGLLPHQTSLRVSTYDKVSNMLVAMLVFVGSLVGLMFAIWLTFRLTFSQVAVPIELVQYAGRGDHAEGIARDLEAPGPEELEEEITEPKIEDTLEKVTDVITTQAAALDAVQSDSAVNATGEGGLGDSRGPGPLGEGRSDLIPPWDRWEIHFTTAGIDAYAAQLDFFKIELAATGGGMADVQYARNLAKSKPDTRTGDSKSENRIYMNWKGGGPLAAFDRQLMQKAGIGTNRRLVLQFYPKETEIKLMTAEALSARDKGHTDAREFLKTIFGVRAARGGYEFFVIDQYFRPAPAI